MEPPTNIPPEHRLVELLSGYFDQSLSAAECQELDRRLASSASARSLYWEMAQLHGVAREWGLEREARALAGALPISRHRGAKWMSAAAVLLIGLISATWLLWPSASKPIGRTTPQVLPSTQDGMVASVADADNAVWAEPERISPEGRVGPGLLRLRAGSARLVFDNGAEVLLDAPTDLAITAADSTRLHAGAVLVNAPPTAKGFTVLAGSLTVIDQGTRFGMSVSETRPAEVHVFKGVVDLHPTQTPQATTRLMAGQAVRSSSAAPQTIPLSLAGLPSPGRFPDARAQEAARLSAWRAASRQFSAEPGMIVHYRLDEKLSPGMAVQNDAPVPVSGSLTGGVAAPGRWAGKNALRFSGRTDGIDLSIPDTYTSLTLGIWVRLDELPNAFNSLLRSNRTGRGATHWHIDNTGRVRFGYDSGYAEFQAPDSGGLTPWEVVVSPPVMLDRLGQWTFLSVVYDAKSATAAHYLNGVEISKQSLRHPLPITMGRSTLGNAPSAAGSEAFYLSGRVDEFFVVNRALSAGELRKLYESSHPEY